MYLYLLLPQRMCPTCPIPSMTVTATANAATAMQNVSYLLSSSGLVPALLLLLLLLLLPCRMCPTCSTRPALLTSLLLLLLLLLPCRMCPTCSTRPAWSPPC